MPNIVTVLASTSETATPVFNWILPTALYFLGIVIGSLVLVFLTGLIIDAVRALLRRRADTNDMYHNGGDAPVSYVEYFRSLRSGDRD